MTPCGRSAMEATVLSRLDSFLLSRVFQPTADAMDGFATPTEAARFCVTGAMVFLLARMLASAAAALPDWSVLIDLASLWGGMVLMNSLTVMPLRRFNPFRTQFGLAR